MQKQLFFIISLYLITYSFSADTDPCVEHEEESECNEDTTNNCEWTDTKECAAATCTGLLENPCKAIASCAWDSSGGSCGDTTDACTGLTASSTPKCADATYCVWTAGNTTCAAVDCTKLDGTEAACTGAKGCSLTVTGGTCAKKSSNTSGGNGGSTGSDSAFGLKTSLTLLIIGFLL